MRGSLRVHAWMLLVLCGWSVWTAVQERVGRRATSLAHRQDIDRDRQPGGVHPKAHARARDPRSLPN
ncbi:MAG: hypothetical protein FWD17_09080 [Polyangiaceae bacterium]|nr:hypothetical protein [Polyangiaceae bacterium]